MPKASIFEFTDVIILLWHTIVGVESVCLARGQIFTTDLISSKWNYTQLVFIGPLNIQLIFLSIELYRVLHMANIFNGSCNIIIIGRTGPFIYRVNSKSEYCFLASALKTGKKGLRLHAPSALNDFIVYVHRHWTKRKILCKKCPFSIHLKHTKSKLDWNMTIFIRRMRCILLII